jgi:2-enoate reductase
MLFMKKPAVQEVLSEAAKACGYSGAAIRKMGDPIPGAAKGIEAVDYLLGKAEIGENVVVIGGGLTGCEIAYELYLLGKKPTIVEMKHDLIVSDAICLANTSYLRDFFTANKVPVLLETGVAAITDEGVLVRDKSGKETTLSADSVIFSVGYKPDPIAKKGKNIHVIGDAKEVGNLRTVIWNAWDVAMKL